MVLSLMFWCGAVSLTDKAWWGQSRAVNEPLIRVMREWVLELSAGVELVILGGLVPGCGFKVWPARGVGRVLSCRSATPLHIREVAQRAVV